MSDASVWTQIRALKVGEHLHLDDCVAEPPPPGSGAWLPIMTQLLPRLLARGGAWTISMPIGTIKRLPSAPVTITTILELVDRDSLVEPPAVYRMRDALVASTWEGEHHRWIQLLEPLATEVISVSRSRFEAAAGEDFSVAVLYEIRRRP